MPEVWRRMFTGRVTAESPWAWRLRPDPFRLGSMGIWSFFTGRSKQEQTIQLTKPIHTEARQQASIYLPSERFADLLKPGPNGLPPLHIVAHKGAYWLAEDSTGLLVNVGNRFLRKLGIWSVSVRGTRYYDQTSVKTGPAFLIREPNNVHDPNAVAIHVNGSTIGYFNKQMAVGLAKEIDAGAQLYAYVISAGEEVPTKVIAGEITLLNHLFRTVR